MKFKVNVVKVAVFLALGLGCFEVEVGSRTVFAQNVVDSEQEAKLNEYRKLLKDYVETLYDKKIDINDVSDSDRKEVARLAEKLREFKNQVTDVPPEQLDDYVCDFIEREAGRFNVVDKEEFKRLGSFNTREYLWQAFNKDVASHFKNGEFKIDGSYAEGLRGQANIYRNIYRYDAEDPNRRFGGQNLFGGLELRFEDLNCGDLWRDYSNMRGCFEDKVLSKKLEMEVGKLSEILGFSIDFEDARQIDLKHLKRYRYLLMLEYPEEFGFMDEVLKMKSIIPKHEKLRKDGRCGCCWHDFSLEDFFDYGRQVEKETQKELFGESMFDLKMSGLSKEELKKKTSELQDKLETLEYAEKLRENLLKANKKSHITNKNYYLLKNYALLAKLLGYDVIVNREEKEDIGTVIVLNAEKISVCSERIFSKDEMRAIQGK